MIRRDAGDSFFLITQHDHALLAGEMARHIGNERFAPPSPFDSVIFAIAQHDCAWPLHDNHPTLNAERQPRHVFESPCDIALRVWTTSVERVAAKDPYAGLLVSLHAMALARHAVSHQRDDSPETARQELFKFNRFMHQQAELQESLRLKLGMRVDAPLRGGLAKPGRSSEEDQLLANFHLLQFMDQLSLNLCFDRLIFETVRPVYPRPGEPMLEVRLQRESEGILRIEPWPFDAKRLDLSVVARKIPARAYQDQIELQQIYAAAPTDNLAVVVTG
ncbi:MAG: DUF3891 family protein [Planctomycetota bacterium]|nr:DUF3891 family protein [Planctomycetota bacterium]